MKDLYGGKRPDTLSTHLCHSEQAFKQRIQNAKRALLH